MRKRLKDNDILNLNCSHCQNEFVIDCTLGEGASSIVYAAHTVDSYGNIKKYRIKECYPVTCEIKREGNKIIWQNESEKENAFSRFEDAYNVISNLQCNEALGNNLTHVCEMYTGNDTLYIVMDTNFGQTYNQDTETDLKKILNTILVISKVIKQFHSQGLLYLDLKPENIMVCYEPNVWVWLFDMDSVILLSDLRNEPGRSISYSNGFAAPEQVMGLRNKIGFATDIYSIGAILFSKIMGRTVTNDDMGFFAEWEFEDEKFSKVNPIVPRLISNIFKKTISASAKRRYQSTDDLIEALEEVIAILSKGAPYLTSAGIQKTIFALGRDNEVDKIHEAFSEGKHAVFLHGDGGIGKSTIANLYGNRFKKEYNAVIFCRYDGSLETVEKRLIDNIKNCNIDENCIEEKRRILSDVLNQKTLIIVDNFDVTIDEDDYLSDFLQYNANMIFTTRTDFSSVFGGDIVQIEVNTLERRAIIELFCNNSDMEVSSLDSIKLLEEIFRCVENNTYAVELLAKQMKASGNSLVELHEKISSGIYSFHNSEKINTVKDGKIIRSNISSIIENLFNVFNLPEMYKQVLMNVHLLGFLDITKDVYRRITNCSSEEMDALNELIELGWIKQGYYGFYLHQLVEDLVKNNLNPDEEKCDTVYDYLKCKMEESLEKIPDYFDAYRGSYEEYKFDENCKFICSFFTHTTLNKNSDIELLLYWMEKLMGNECRDIPSSSSGTFWDRLYDTMEAAIKEDISPKNAFELGYIVMMVWLDEYNVTYWGEDDIVASQKAKREEKALQSL